MTVVRFRAVKALGQHFLHDEGICRDIVAAAGELRDRTVVEVGPGPGMLTRCLLESRAPVIIAIEKDSRFIENLTALDPVRLQIIHEDAIAWFAAYEKKEKNNPNKKRENMPVVVANLPYNISTPLMIYWLRSGLVPVVVITIQKEVADRLTAQVGSRAYGRLSVMAQWRGAARRVRIIEPGAFTPPPKVRSAVIRLDIKPPDPLWPMMEAVVAMAFGQRRKTLRASLRGIDPQGVFMQAAGIDAGLRPQNITAEQFSVLAMRLKDASVKVNQQKSG